MSDKTPDLNDLLLEKGLDAVREAIDRAEEFAFAENPEPDALEVEGLGLPECSDEALALRFAQRGQGIGRRLMEAVEAAAREAGRTLLVLDTRQGDVAEGLYARHGYVRAGAIPMYARSADGTLDATVIFYRLLEQLQTES